MFKKLLSAKKKKKKKRYCISTQAGVNNLCRNKHPHITKQYISVRTEFSITVVELLLKMNYSHMTQVKLGLSHRYIKTFLQLLIGTISEPSEGLLNRV